MHAEDAYLFRHALLRDAAYQLHMPTDRAALHKLALEIIETMLPPGAQDALAGELAEHARSAQAAQPDPALAQKELHYLLRAGRHAATHYQNRQALEIFERICRHPQADATTREQAELDAACQQGNLAEHAQAAQRLERLLENMSGRSDRLAASARIELARCLYKLGKSERLDELMREALDTPLGDVRAEAAVTFCVMLLERGRRAEGTALLEEAIKLAREYKQADVEAQALGLLGSVCAELGDMPKARQLLEHALERQRALGNPRGEGRAAMALSRLFHQLGDREQGESAARSALAIFERLGLQSEIMNALTRVAGMIRMQGKMAQAEPMTVRALELCRELGDSMGEISALTNLAGLYKHTGRYAESEAAYLETLKLLSRYEYPRMQGHLRANYAQLLHFMGRLEESKTEFEQGLALMDTSPDRAVQAAQSGRFAALLAEMGQLPRAEALMNAARGVLTEIGNNTDLQAIEESYAKARARAGQAPSPPKGTF